MKDVEVSIEPPNCPPKNKEACKFLIYRLENMLGVVSSRIELESRASETLILSVVLRDQIIYGWVLVKMVEEPMSGKGGQSYLNNFKRGESTCKSWMVCAVPARSGGGWTASHIAIRLAGRAGERAGRHSHNVAGIF